MKRLQILLTSMICLLTACSSDSNGTESEAIDLQHGKRKGDVELHQTGGGKVEIVTDEDEQKTAQKDSKPVEQ